MLIFGLSFHQLGAVHKWRRNILSNQRKSVDWTDQRSSNEWYISEDTMHINGLGIPIWKRAPTERSSECSATVTQKDDERWRGGSSEKMIKDENSKDSRESIQKRPHWAQLNHCWGKWMVDDWIGNGLCYMQLILIINTWAIILYLCSPTSDPPIFSWKSLKYH